MEPKLAIIIVSYNCADYLKNCLTSVFAKPPSCSYHIYVVDNNSKDNTEAMLKGDFPQVELIINKENKGFAAANNIAMKKSKSPYFLLLNPDTIIVEENTFDFMISYLEQHPEVGAVGCKHLDKEKNLQLSVSTFWPSPLVLLYSYSCFLRYFVPKSLGERFIEKLVPYSSETEVKVVGGACFLTKREVTDRVGLMDEDYFLYADDIDWCYRILKDGWKIVYLPQVSIIHDVGQGGSEKVGSKELKGRKSIFIFAKKHFGRFKAKLVRDYLLFEHTLKLIAYQCLALYPPIKPKMTEKIAHLKAIIDIFKQIKL